MIAISRGAKGPHTRKLQERLNSLGYDLEVDGVYGDSTIAAVIKFQTDHKLKVDGIAGPEVFKVLNPRIFISYSRKDSKWLERLLVHLKPLERAGIATTWDDTLLAPGEKWRKVIQRELKAATAAILLISADFLASDFIDDNELPPLLAAAETKGLRIFPIIVGKCQFEQHEILSQFHTVNPPSKPLGRMTRANQEEIFHTVAVLIRKACKR